ncbi:MAG: NAD-dependent epimerase/dehydratase family protein [Bacteroidales bacterium]
MIFVTGGTGLVGSHLLYALTSRGTRVRALYRSGNTIPQVARTFGYYTEKTKDLLDRIEWVEGELIDLRDNPEYLDGVDEFYHCAAMVSFESRNRKLMLQNNIEGTASVVNACLARGGIRLCFVSSVAALGSSIEGEMVEESHLWKPSEGHSAYSISKFHSEMEVWRGMSEGLEAFIVNPSIILGPGNWSKGSSVLFQTFYKGMRFYTTGVTGYVDVRDVTGCMIRLMEQKTTGERYILNSENLSYREIFTLLSRAFGKRDPDIPVGRILGMMAVFGTGLLALFTGKPATITRETLRSSRHVTYYSNRKILEKTNCTFRPVAQSVNEIASLFLRDRANC